MVKDHSDRLHGLFFLFISKGYFICTIPFFNPEMEYLLEQEIA